MIDVLVRNGRVLDGTGSPWFLADVAVSAGRIVAVGDLRGEPAVRTIDGDGLVVCPGFVDMHTHSDLQLLANPAHEAKVHQGVTLDVLGQDGLGLAPANDDVAEQLRAQLASWNGDPAEVERGWRSVADYLGEIDRRGAAVNTAYLVPHGTIRMCVLGNEDRPPTESELERMRGLVAQGLADGGVGLSAGLTYTPGMYADDDELVALCSVMAGSGGYYAPHHRNYGLHALEAYADCVEIARRADVPLHLTHCHLGFPVNRGRAGELLRIVDDARGDGVDVTLDTYPYAAGSTYLHALLPSWVQAGGAGATVERLRSTDLRERIRVELEETGSDGFHDVPVDWAAVVVSDVGGRPGHPLVGRALDEVAAERGERPVDVYCELLADERLSVQCILHVGNEENVREIMRHPAHMAGSDGILVGERPHPRAWGTFARYLETYVRELGVLTWEEAIRKLTSLPARRLGLVDRGLVRPGMAADLVCFDPERVAERATFEEPRQLASGFEHVLVNGRAVIDGGRHTGDLPGRTLRRGARA